MTNLQLADVTRVTALPAVVDAVQPIKAEEKKQRERENTAKLEKIEALVSELSYENKIKLFWELTNDPDIIVNVLSKSGISVERINTCCREILK